MCPLMQSRSLAPTIHDARPGKLSWTSSIDEAKANRAKFGGRGAERSRPVHGGRRPELQPLRGLTGFEKFVRAARVLEVIAGQLWLCF